VLSVEWGRNIYVNLKVEIVRGVNVGSSRILGCKIDAQVYLGKDNLGELSVSGIIVLKMGVIPN
jgi:hypothetical protein